MKTSNKLIFIASFITIAYLTVYDLGLKAEYDKGEFRKRFYHMQQMAFTNFNVIEHHAGNIISIQVEKGPYGVWVKNSLKKDLSITQHGQALQIDFIDKKDNYYSGYEICIIISCPEVKAFTTSPFTNDGIEKQNRYFRQNGNSMIIDYYPHGTSIILGFNQAAMSLTTNRFTEIELKKNTIGQLTAVVGDKAHGMSGLTINAGNHIASANFQIPGKSSLTLDDVLIGKVAYQSSDSTQVTLTGKASHLLDHQ